MNGWVIISVSGADFMIGLRLRPVKSEPFGSRQVFASNGLHRRGLS